MTTTSQLAPLSVQKRIKTSTFSSSKSSKRSLREIELLLTTSLNNKFMTNMTRLLAQNAVALPTNNGHDCLYTINSQPLT